MERVVGLGRTLAARELRFVDAGLLLAERVVPHLLRQPVTLLPLAVRDVVELGVMAPEPLALLLLAPERAPQPLQTRLEDSEPNLLAAEQEAAGRRGDEASCDEQPAHRAAGTPVRTR